MSTFYIYKKEDDLLHYGILGMKWGIRRYQKRDGSLTRAGRKKYLKDAKKAYEKGELESYVRKTISKNDIKNQDVLKNLNRQASLDTSNYMEEYNKLQKESETNTTAKKILEESIYTDRMRDAIRKTEAVNNKKIKKTI